MHTSTRKNRSTPANQSFYSCSFVFIRVQNNSYGLNTGVVSVRTTVAINLHNPGRSVGGLVHGPLTSRSARASVPLYPRIGRLLYADDEKRPRNDRRTDHDALQFWCVMFRHLVRHELNRIISLPHMHTAPPKTLNPELTPNTVPSGAHPSFVRHLRRRVTHIPSPSP